MHNDNNTLYARSWAHPVCVDDWMTKPYKIRTTTPPISQTRKHRLKQKKCVASTEWVRSKHKTPATPHWFHSRSSGAAPVLLLGYEQSKTAPHSLRQGHQPAVYSVQACLSFLLGFPSILPLPVSRAWDVGAIPQACFSLPPTCSSSQGPFGRDTDDDFSWCPGFFCQGGAS